MTAITVLDGGMGKELRRIGAPFRQPEWSALALMEAPEFVEQAHRNFVDAGARVITTNNYAVVPYHLGDDVVATRGHELIELAGRLARDVADAANAAGDGGPAVLVAGSLPPLFGSYEPHRFDPARAPRLYDVIVAALAPSVDVWLAETLGCVAELDATAEAVDRTGGSSRMWVSFTLRDDDTVALPSGETIADVVDGVERHLGLVDAVLFNCAPPERIGPAIAALTAELDRRGLDLRTGGYANAFDESQHDQPLDSPYVYAANTTIFERRVDLTRERYVDIVDGWVAGGASIVGGCCEMYPEHIEALACRFG